MTVASVLLFGFLIGLRHALEADHLAAVATLATRQSTPAQTMLQGAAWGVGHTLTLGLVGGAVLLMGTTVPEDIARGLEFVVGVMLLFLGLDVIRRLVRDRIHFHVHRHAGDEKHFHAHSHVAGPSHQGHPHMRRAWPLRALCIGMVHGMAGSAALVLLTLESVSSVGVGVLYILIFGVGSITGMALLSLAIALPLRLTAAKLNLAHRGLTAVVGLTSCGIGLHIIHSIATAA